MHFNEAMKSSRDLDPGVGLFIYEDTLTLYNPNNDKVYGYVGLKSVKNPIFFRTKEGLFYTFPAIAAQSGFGPLIYEFALMYVKTKDSNLMVARDGDIRDKAFNVWKKFYNRADVLKKTLPMSHKAYNFAIVTGDDDFSGMPKEIEYEFHTQNGNEKDIIIYNTMMSMEPSKEFFSLQEKYTDLDLEEISDMGRDFFSEYYNNY